MILAKLGDVVKVNVTQPIPQTYALTLATPESVAYANELLNDPDKSGWWLDSGSENGRDEHG
jgi:hypothetical protein